MTILSKEVEDLIRSIAQRQYTTVEPVYDETRVYTYGAQVLVGAWDIPSQGLINNMREWCNNTFGPKPYGEYYGDRWMVSNNTFWFKNERDRTVFLLKWANVND